MLQGGPTNGFRFKDETAQLELDKEKAFKAPVHFVSL